MGSLWQEAVVMQDCRETQGAPAGVYGLLLALLPVAQHLQLLVQAERLQRSVGEVVLGKIWGTQTEGAVVRDDDGAL